MALALGDGRPSRRPLSATYFIMGNVKTTPVPDELLRELHRITAKHTSSKNGLSDLASLMEKLPSPPPLDPVEECGAAAKRQCEGHRFDWNDLARAAIIEYRRLGCPEIHE